MKKILCLGEVASHNWVELLVKEEYITHKKTGCPSGFDVTQTYNFDYSHRIYDKKHLLFLMVLFEEIMSSSIVNFHLEKVEDAGLIKNNYFHLFERIDNYSEFAKKDKNYFDDIALDFMANNKKSLINYLSKDILHTSYFEVNAEQDYNSFFTDPPGDGVLKEFNPNTFILRNIKDALSKGLKLSQFEEICFYNGRLFYSNKNYDLKDGYDLSSFSDSVRYILQLDLTPQINEFPIPANMTDVLFLRKQPEIVSFREVFFEWIGCLTKNQYDIAKKIKNDVIKANMALEKYRKWEKKSSNFFYCTIDALVGFIPYLSDVLGVVSPYSLRKTINDKNKNSWVSLLK